MVYVECEKIWSYPGCSKAEIDSCSGVQICSVLDWENPRYGDVAAVVAAQVLVPVSGVFAADFCYGGMACLCFEGFWWFLEVYLSRYTLGSKELLIIL